MAASITIPAMGEPVDDKIAVDGADWPWWRGPARNGVANPNQDPPTEWGVDRNLVWKAEIPGHGHGSPTVVGRRVFVATSDEKTGSQSVLCYDRDSGKQRWNATAHAKGAMRKHAKSSGASSTVACDGESAFITFANSGAVYATAFDLDGKQRWQTKLCPYLIHQGYGASPAIYQSLVLVVADSYAGGVLAALDRKTGEIVWKRDRPRSPNYTSPILLHTANKDQLMLIGCNLIASFDPLTGKTLWETKGATTECVTSTVTDGGRVFSSGGYPKNHLQAVSADGSAKILWETKDRVYVPSLLARDGHLFGVMDSGIAVCWKCDDGKVAWKARLGGDFSASPVLVGDKIYAANEAGETFIFRANPAKFEQIAKNKLGDQAMATPAIFGGRLYYRATEYAGDLRHDVLYAIAKVE